jgi:hypothetical protein
MFCATHYQEYRVCKACRETCDPSEGRYVKPFGWLCDPCGDTADAMAETEHDDRKRGFNA